MKNDDDSYTLLMFSPALYSLKQNLQEMTFKQIQHATHSLDLKEYVLKRVPGLTYMISIWLNTMIRLE